MKTADNELKTQEPSHKTAGTEPSRVQGKTGGQQDVNLS
jgi:hypothetical protein